MIGVAWTVFGVPHLIYHASQFGGMAMIDVIGNVIGLGGSLILGILLMLPGPRARRSHQSRHEQDHEEKESRI
ncbi:hypothetical protein ACWGJP_02520 [Microbacterium sp. NPDC055903]